MIQPASLAMTAGAIAIFAAAQTTPFGWAADIVAIGVSHLLYRTSCCGTFGCLCWCWKGSIKALYFKWVEQCFWSLIESYSQCFSCICGGTAAAKLGSMIKSMVGKVSENSQTHPNEVKTQKKSRILHCNIGGILSKRLLYYGPKVKMGSRNNGVLAEQESN